MVDLEKGEILYVACVCGGKAEVLRVRYERVAPRRDVKPGKRIPSLTFVVCNDKGTEIDVPASCIYKWREDALARAEVMAK